MALHDVALHQGCPDYASEETVRFLQLRYLPDARISDLNRDRNALVYVLEGALSSGSKQLLGEGQLFLLPRNLDFDCRALSSSRLVACFFEGQLPLCNKYDFSALQREARQHPSQLPPPSGELYLN